MMRNAYSTYLLFILVLTFCITTVIEELTAFPSISTNSYISSGLPNVASDNDKSLNTAATPSRSFPKQQNFPFISPKKNNTVTCQTDVDNQASKSNQNREEPVQSRSIIESFIWADTNNNGKFDQGEIPLTDITVRLLSNQGLVLQMTTTDDKGEFVFNDLESGDYMITADLTTVSYQMRPSTPSLYYISLFEPTVFWTEGFGFAPHEEFMNRLTGSVELDPVKQTQLANDELNVQINLLDRNGYIIGSSAPAADGSYTFYNIEEGVYSVEKIIADTNKSDEISLLRVEE
ncbi:MAG: SdrD B-like domain-containing protein [Chitinophagales bacterium]